MIYVSIFKCFGADGRAGAAKLATPFLDMDLPKRQLARTARDRRRGRAVAWAGTTRTPNI